MYSRREFLGRVVAGGGAAVGLLKTGAIADVAEVSSAVGPDVTPEELAAQEWYWARVQNAFDLDRSIVHVSTSLLAEYSPG